MISASPVDSPRWPGTEPSAYADWWMEAERISGARDQLDGLGILGFQPVVGLDGHPRFRATSQFNERSDRTRRLPLWKQCLPDTAESQNGGGMAEVKQQAEFGDPLLAVKPPKAVMVIIDTAINPLHEQFRGQDGAPRVLAHWLMEGKYRADNRVPFGREIRKDEIGGQCGKTETEGLRALCASVFHTPFAPRGAAQSAAHGTHVLGLAAGVDPGEKASDTGLLSVPILAVSLPSNRLLSASGVFLDAFVDQALEWVSCRMSEAFAPLPETVVVNLSYGLAAGPKDGTGYLTERIRHWLSLNPAVTMFMPAGNDGLAKGHARLEAPTNEIGWLVPPADRFSTHAEVWFDTPPTGAGPATLILTPPSGVALRFAADQHGVQELRSDTGALVGRVYDLGLQHPDRRSGFLICLAATRPLSPTAPKAPAGIWRIGIDGAAGADVDLQSERPLTPDSAASHPAILVPLSPDGAKPSRCGTLNAVARGAGVTIVNGEDKSLRRYLDTWKAPPPGCRPLKKAAKAAATCLGPDDGALAHWTSLEPAGGPHADNRTERYPADRSRANPGLLAPGYRSGSVAIVEGTSFACALASRAKLMAAVGP